MIDFVLLNKFDWIAIYEYLDNDGELNEEGKKELERLRR